MFIDAQSKKSQGLGSGQAIKSEINFPWMPGPFGDHMA